MVRITALVAFVLWGPLQAVSVGELPNSEPAEVGLSAEMLANLKPAPQKLVDSGKIPGGVALIARHGKVAYLTTFGYRDLASKTPMTEDTIFAIDSMTKPITCVALISDRGFVRYLTDRIFKPLDRHDTSFFVPEARQDRVATIYRSGLVGPGSVQAASHSCARRGSPDHCGEHLQASWTRRFSFLSRC